MKLPPVGLLEYLTHIVNNNVDNLTFLENERMRKLAVYQRVGGISSGGEQRVKGWHLGRHIGDVLEESTAIFVSNIYQSRRPR